MTDRSTLPLVDRPRRAGKPLPTTPDIAAIVVRSAQRKRRRQIGVTAASVVAIGGLGFTSAQLLGGAESTTIEAAVVPALAVGATPTIPAVTPTTSADATGGYDTAADAAAPPAPTSTVLPVTTTAGEGVNSSVQAARRSDLADELGGAIVVSDGQLAHRSAEGAITAFDVPPALATTERRVTDVADLYGRPFALVTDFTDRPDLVEATDGIHQDLAIYAIDLTTDEVHVVEQRTITELDSPEWVYNGQVTVRNGHLVVVRELWQAMCVYVESLQLDGTIVETPSNPLPEPSLDGLDAAAISEIQAGRADPPRGCISADELPDGASSVLQSQADPTALEAVNEQLRSAAAVTADALRG